MTSNQSSISTQSRTRAAQTSNPLPLRTLPLACVGSLLALGSTGCLVAGYSSSGGAFIWPGGLGLVFLVLLIVFLLRRR